MTPAILVLALVLAGQPTMSAAANADIQLFDAVKLGQSTRIKESIAKGADVNASDRRGLTPLMWASAGGDLDVVRELLASGASVDRHAGDGTTALMLAASNGFREIAEALILRGANVAASRAGVRARQMAEHRDHPEVVALLEKAEDLGARLLRAATEGNDTAVRQLLSLGAPMNTTDDRGATALMIGARGGDLGIVQALMARGADATIRDNAGQDVFDWIGSSPTGKYVSAYLLDHGASRDAPRERGPMQSPQVKASLATLADIILRIPAATGATRAAVRRASAVLSQLQALSAKWPANSPDDYRDNLAGDVRALEMALAAGVGDALAATIVSVAEDLEVKLEHCIRSGGALGGSVTVHVRTVQGADEIKSWQVFYMPRVFEAAANATPDLFPQLSSPTEESLPPGRYVMWVRDPSTARVGERTVVKVGEGKKELLLDLPVPAAPPR